VNQVISVISQNPFRVCESFHAYRILAVFGQLPADLFTDGLDLFRIPARAENEKVREGRYLA
jgi:hypothetical protein